jgi:hypothetical protein
MMRRVALTGAAFLLSAATAAAAAPPTALEKAFSGTIVTTYPDGRSQKLWMNPDGSYTSEGRRHGRYKGHWRVKGDKVCFRRSIFGYCTHIPSGTSFRTKAVNGETVQVRLVPGRAGEAAG